MVSRLIFEPIVCYSRYWIFRWTNPYRKTFNINLGGPEINSHWRQSERHIKFNNLHDEDIAHKR